MGLDFSLDKIPLVGTWFTNPDEDFQRQQYHNMALALAAQRPEYAQAWQNAMMQGQTIAQPYQNAMAEMYGPGAQTNMMQANQTPISPRGMALGSPNDVQGSGNPFHPAGVYGSSGPQFGGGPPQVPVGVQGDYAAALAQRMPQGQGGGR